jgi:hypothetical protein
MSTGQADLFDVEAPLPEGLVYRREFLSLE